MYLTGLCQVQQLHDKTRDMLWKCAKMQDMPIAVYYTYRSSTEHARFSDQTTSHNTVSSQQIIYRIGIKLIQSLIDLIGVLDFGNILG